MSAEYIKRIIELEFLTKNLAQRVTELERKVEAARNENGDPESFEPETQVWQTPEEDVLFVSALGWFYSKLKGELNWDGPWADDGNWKGFIKVTGPKRVKVIRSWLERTK